MIARCGDVIRIYRAARRISQLKLAKRAGIHPVVLSRIENGSSTTVGAIEALAGALGVDPAVIFAEAYRLAKEGA